MEILEILLDVKSFNKEAEVEMLSPPRKMTLVRLSSFLTLKKNFLG